MEIKEIIKLSRECLEEAPVRVEKLPGAGSSRRYYRLYYAPATPNGKETTAIATAGDDLRENRAFCELCLAFDDYAEQQEEGLTVPSLYGHTPDYRIYLQEDLGDISLLDVIQRDGEVAGPVENALDRLLEMQLVPKEIWQRLTYSHPFDEMRVLGDLNYFKYCFLKPSGIAFDDDSLNVEMAALARRVCDYDPALDGFMYRDFQSRNVMMRLGKYARCIDFQGGMEGPVLYDAISLLWQAKAAFSPEFRRRMLTYYIERLCERKELDATSVWPLVDRFVMLRTLQVLGAYGFRGLIERKAHFIESIPAGLKNLAEVVASGVLDDYPELRRCCVALTELERFKPATHHGLLVEVGSFSFKKGYPENLTGNGGGFVFDCRGMHNPGRYAEYRPLTGMDREVIDFLEEQGEVQGFMANALGLVVPAVETYLRRGFTNLQVAFGCTGGRHRSVYCAEAMARELRSRFPELQIRLIHREQGIDKMY